MINDRNLDGTGDAAGGSANIDGAADLDGIFSSPAVVKKLRTIAPSNYAAAQRFWQSAQKAPALTPRVKELILLALHATSTALDSDGVRRHADRAVAAGASEQDIFDVLLTIVGIANHALYFAVPVLMRELRSLGHPDAELPPITAESETVKEEFIRARGFWNDQRDVIVRAMPDYFTALAQLSAEPWTNGSLTDKERELVCIGIDCTVTHMYEPGLVIHIRGALKQGATRAEILEVFHLAAMTGLSGYILGAEALYGLDNPRR
ncbi:MULTISPECIES: carboxymuconolactone decarboxylase family protein [Paraburkholderia]|uniref:Alkylhydroperoxidase/carboxymuconolactone decarboxylase family protein YurZ n=2 Tax=Paraburkholderia TaxID=1822464 RepID=A0A7W8P2S9_9BURK|nr:MULTISPECIES: carboxymuconolactone decarboxylase family protein [Paraburkholderia]MBB5399403.1 alkylhydroperoxidase/carboxymuconolactone decarboxylase family protein YurZ [Paraburkholderia youngii]MBB5422620.1 alkylhydroperoxidase/carboxymuconolactone decarboxylase family protein YurZ [Paraburkholderia atlantica]